MVDRPFTRDHRIDFDVDSTEFNDRYYEVLDDLVQHCPVAHSVVGAGYSVVTGYDSVRRAAEDWRSFTSSQGFVPNRPPGLKKFLPAEIDPPEQTAWRKIINPYFSPGLSASLESKVRQIAHDCIDGFIGTGRADFVNDFAAVVPSRTFFENMVLVPQGDLAAVLASVKTALIGPIEQRPAAQAHNDEYVAGFLRRRMEEPPRGDFVDAVLAGFELDGVEASFEDKVSAVITVLTGSTGTVTYVLSSIANHLARHPDDRRALAEDPSGIPVAVEEYLRHFAPSPYGGRAATCPVEVEGHAIPEGEFVMVAWAAANRDPRVFTDPARLDIARTPNRHLTFGHGVHRCPGSNLAKMELRVATEVLLDRLPEFEIAPGTEPVLTTGLVRTMTDLHIRFPEVRTEP